MHQYLVGHEPVENPPTAEQLGRALGLAVTDWETRHTQGEEFSQPPSTYFIREALLSLNVTASKETIDSLTDVLFGSELAVRAVEPDTRETLELLFQRGLRIGCVTNTLLLEKAILSLLDDLDLRRYFGSVVVSSETGFRKPHPSLFQRALEEVAASAPDTAFVGDSLQNDVAGAKAIGMRAVLTRQYRREPLDGADPPPDAVISRLHELPDVLAHLDATT
jgi:putative hydrolase of the HAD superfamily